MKRIISVLLSLIIIMSCTMAYAEEMGAEFSIEAIPNNYDGNYFKMNITLPEPVDGGTLIIAFYTDGVCTKIIKRDASSANEFTIDRKNAADRNDAKYSITPDTIKLMLWEKDKIRPLYSAQNGLTAEVYKTANKEVLELLDNLLPTTTAIRKLLEGYSNKEKDIEAVVKTEITSLIDAIDKCEAKAKKNGYGQNELLTAEYCKREFSEELIEIQRLYAKASEESKRVLNNYYSTDLDTNFSGEEYSEVISNFMGFFNIKIF